MFESPGISVYANMYTYTHFWNNFLRSRCSSAGKARHLQAPGSPGHPRSGRTACWRASDAEVTLPLPGDSLPQANMEAARIPLEDLVPFTKAFWELRSDLTFLTHTSFH